MNEVSSIPSSNIGQPISSYEALKEEGWYVPPVDVITGEPTLTPVEFIPGGRIDIAWTRLLRPTEEQLANHPMGLMLSGVTVQTTRGEFTFNIPKGATIVDLCSGAGNVARAFAKQHPEDRFVLVDATSPGAPDVDGEPIPMRKLEPNIRLLVHYVGRLAESIPSSLVHSADIVAGDNYVDLLERIVQSHGDQVVVSNVIESQGIAQDIARMMKLGGVYVFGHSIVKSYAPYDQLRSMHTTKRDAIVWMGQVLRDSGLFDVYEMTPGDNAEEIAAGWMDKNNPEPLPVFAVCTL